MARVGYTTIGGGLIGADKQVQRRYLWMGRGTVASKRQIYRRSELKALPGRSLLSQIGAVWTNLSEAVQGDWNDAGAIIGQHGYNLFVQDKAYRIKHELAGDATPSTFHQYLVGHLNIPIGAGGILLRQSGNLMFDFPAYLRVRRKTALVADNGNGEFVKVRFKYTYDEGGGELTETTELTLPLSEAWGLQEIEVVEHTGLTGDWELEIETSGLKGDAYLDDVWVDFLSNIITKDPYCLDVVRYWSKINFPSGVAFETIYPTGDAL